MRIKARIKAEARLAKTQDDLTETAAKRKLERMLLLEERWECVETVQRKLAFSREKLKEKIISDAERARSVREVTRQLADDRRLNNVKASLERSRKLELMQQEERLLQRRRWLEGTMTQKEASAASARNTAGLERLLGKGGPRAATATPSKMGRPSSASPSGRAERPVRPHSALG
mmetsp:Transcript_8136/g.27045  ORF Transcript_8136/g.27045 Transcript_8136/m.27045 type:complete len:175 (+) Transcript_8136:1299-1823(+)